MTVFLCILLLLMSFPLGIAGPSVYLAYLLFPAYSDHGSQQDLFKCYFRSWLSSDQSPLMALSLLRVNAKVLAILHKALCGLTSVASLTSTPTTVTLAYSTQASFISLLFLDYARHVSARGLLHWLFPLPECSFLRYIHS